MSRLPGGLFGVPDRFTHALVRRSAPGAKDALHRPEGASRYALGVSLGAMLFLPSAECGAPPRPREQNRTRGESPEMARLPERKPTGGTSCWGALFFKHRSGAHMRRLILFPILASIVTVTSTLARHVGRPQDGFYSGRTNCQSNGQQTSGWTVLPTATKAFLQAPVTQSTKPLRWTERLDTMPSRRMQWSTPDCRNVERYSMSIRTYAKQKNTKSAGDRTALGEV